MIPRSQLITIPSVEFNTLITVGKQALGRSVCEGVDRTSKKLSDAERFLSILAAFKDLNAPVSLPGNLLAHVSFSVLMAALEYDVLTILEVCAGMPFTQTETVSPGISLAVISGTLLQWRDAVVVGCNHQSDEVRLGFNQLHSLFVEASLGAVWNDFEQRQVDEGYILIEYRA